MPSKTVAYPPRSLPQYGINSKDEARRYGMPDDFYGSGDETGRVNSKYRTQEYDDAILSDNRARNVQGINAPTIRRKARERVDAAFKNIVDGLRKAPTAPATRKRIPAKRGTSALTQADVDKAAMLDRAAAMRREAEKRRPPVPVKVDTEPDGDLFPDANGKAPTLTRVRTRIVEAQKEADRLSAEWDRARTDEALSVAQKADKRVERLTELEARLAQAEIDRQKATNQPAPEPPAAVALKESAAALTKAAEAMSGKEETTETPEQRVRRIIEQNNTISQGQGKRTTTYDEKLAALTEAGMPAAEARKWLLNLYEEEEVETTTTPAVTPDPPAPDAPFDHPSAPKEGPAIVSDVDAKITALKAQEEAAQQAVWAVMDEEKKAKEQLQKQGRSYVRDEKKTAAAQRALDRKTAAYEAASDAKDDLTRQRIAMEEARDYPNAEPFNQWIWRMREAWRALRAEDKDAEATKLRDAVNAEVLARWRTGLIANGKTEAQADDVLRHFNARVDMTFGNPLGKYDSVSRLPEWTAKQYDEVMARKKANEELSGLKYRGYQKPHVGDYATLPEIEKTVQEARKVDREIKAEEQAAEKAKQRASEESRQAELNQAVEWQKNDRLGWMYSQTAKQWVPLDGAKVKVITAPGADLRVHRLTWPVQGMEGAKWGVTEQTTGMLVGAGMTKPDAIKAAREKIGKFGREAFTKKVKDVAKTLPPKPVIDAAPAPAPPPPAEGESAPGIEAGEELTYNRRNRVARRNWSDFSALNPALKAREVQKNNVWPTPDYQAMIDGGQDVIPTALKDARALLAHVAKQVRDAVAAKPNVRGVPTDEDFKRYVEGVQRVEAGVAAWLKDEDGALAWLKLQGRMAGTMLGAMRGTPTDISAFVYKGPQKAIIDFVYPDGWKAHRDEVIVVGSNRLLQRLQPGTDEARRAMKDKDAGWPAKREAWQVQGYSVVATTPTVREQAQGRGDPPHYYVEIGVKRAYGLGDSKDRAEAERMASAIKPFALLKKNRLVASFATEEEAVEAARDAVKRESKGQKDIEGTNVSEAERIGAERRLDGQDVDAEKLRETLGLRGVNFGTWMQGQSDRAEAQAHLNHAYDAMLDMAEILNVPPRALALDGMLGLAIGAQGSGQHAAHFVPGLNEINITRTRGAGALSHEWAHGMDHYFGRLAGFEAGSEPFITEHAKADLPGVRPEIAKAFTAIVDAMRRKPITAESAAKLTADRAAQAKETVDRFLKAIRGNDFTDQQEAFDRLAERVRAGDFGEGRVAVGGASRFRHNNVPLALFPVVDEMRQLYRAKHVRLPSLDNYRGLQSWLDTIAYRRSHQDAASAHVPQTMATDYMAEADRLQGIKKGKAYWNTPREMFARAFDAYVADKLQERAAKNTYLAGLEIAAPQGEERKAINAAFDVLVGEIKTRETERGIAMFATGGPTDETTPRAYPKDPATAAVTSAAINRIDAARRKAHEAATAKTETNPAATEGGNAARSDGSRPVDVRADREREVARLRARLAGAAWQDLRNDEAFRLTTIGARLVRIARGFGFKLRFYRGGYGTVHGINFEGNVWLNAAVPMERQPRMMDHEIAHNRDLNEIEQHVITSSPMAEAYRAMYSGGSRSSIDDARLRNEIAAAIACGDVQPIEGINLLDAVDDVDAVLAAVDRHYERLVGMASGNVSQRNAEESARGGGEPPTERGPPPGTLVAGNATVTAPGARQPTQFMVRAYHGTPHTFEPEPGAPLGRFRREKIGTGEGAAAYGWGVAYAAQAKGVAETYRNAGDPAQAYKSGFTELARQQGRSNTVVINGELLNVYQAAQRARDGDVAFMRSLTQEQRDIINRASRGNLYHVELDFDDADTLDWDRPLSEQSEKVRKALIDSGVAPSVMKWRVVRGDVGLGRYGDKASAEAAARQMKGRVVAMPYEDIQGMTLYNAIAADRKGSQAASEYLASLGIRGIRYADQGSRGKPSWMVKYAPGQGYTMHSTRADAEADAKENGGTVVASPQATYNYVVFNESDIRVVGRNGETLTPTQAMGEQRMAVGPADSPVTPAQDAAYMAAVERGDTAEAQRMVDEAARAAGYNVGPVAHGSPERFNAFDTSGEGSHFGTEEQASAVRGKGKLRVRRFYLAVNNPLRLPDLGVWSSFDNLRSHLSLNDHITDDEATAAWEAWQRSDDEGWSTLKRTIRNHGYDGIVYENEQEAPGDSYIAFDAEQIKSADAVTRSGRRVIPLSERFNPATPDIRFAVGPAAPGATPPPTAADTVDSWLAGIRNSEVDAERVRLGLPEAIHGPTRNWDLLTAEAQRVEADNPGYAARLTRDLLDNPRIVSDLDNMLLARYCVRLKIAVEKAADAKDADQERSASAEYDDAMKAWTLAGTPLGQALAARAIMLRQDYSYANQKRLLTLALGHEPSAKKLAELKERCDRAGVLADRVAANTARLLTEAEQNTATIEQVKAEKAWLYGILRQNVASLKATPAVAKTLADREAAVRARMAQRKAQAAGVHMAVGPSAGISDEELADYGTLGAGLLGRGITDVAEWSKRMTDEFGDAVRPHLDPILAESYRQFKDAERETAPAAKPPRKPGKKRIPATRTPKAPAVPAGEPNDAELTRMIRDLAAQKVEAGMVDLEQVMQAVTDDVQDVAPGITRRTVGALFSDYGNAKTPDQDAVAVRLRELRRLEQLAQGLMDVKEGNAPQPSGRQRDKPTQEIREKARELRVAMRDADIKPNPLHDHLATRTETAIRTVENRIADLEKALRTGKQIPESKAAPLVDARLDKLRATRDELLEQYDRVFQRELAHYKRRVAAEIVKAQEAIKKGEDTGDWSRKPRKLSLEERGLLDDEAVAQTIELVKLRRRLERERMTPFDRNMHAIREAGRFLRSLTAGGDVSYIRRQSKILFAHDVGSLDLIARGRRSAIFPVVAKSGLMAYFAESYFDEQMEQDKAEHAEAVRIGNKYGLYTALEADTPIARRVESGLSESVERIPVAGWMYRAGNRSATIINNKGFIALWEQLAPLYRDRGELKTESDERRLAKMIGDMIGRAVMPRAVGFRHAIQFASDFLFSARYQLARGRSVLSLYGVISRSEQQRREGFRTLFGTVLTTATTLAILKAINSALGGDDEDDWAALQLNPLSPDFLKGKIGNTRVDLLSGEAQWMRFMSRFATGKTVNARTGKVEDIGRDRVLDLFLESKQAPVVSLFRKVVFGKGYGGRKIEGARAWTEEMLPVPLWLRDGYEVFADQVQKHGDQWRALTSGAAGAGAAWFGESLQTYDPQQDQKAKQRIPARRRGETERERRRIPSRRRDER